jgi:amidase
MHETLFQSATDAAQMLSHKELSSRELTEMLLTWIDAVNPALNAVVELRREAALHEAAAADEAIARGDDLGPVHGVPMTIKDSFNVADLRAPGGLPVGAQIVGPLYEDNTAITFAELLGDVIGGYEPPPLARSHSDTRSG